MNKHLLFLFSVLFYFVLQAQKFDWINTTSGENPLSASSPATIPISNQIANYDQFVYVVGTFKGSTNVFTRGIQKEKLVESLKYCRENKGLIIYAWCSMSNHLHTICQSANEVVLLSDILRDFKTFTSKQTLTTIQAEPESRREWMLNYFEKSCEGLKRNQKYKVLQTGFHAEEISTQK